MADSIQKLMFNAVFEILQGVTIVAGYRTDVGLNAYRWKSTPWDVDQIPGLDLRDVSTTYEDRIGAMRERTVTLDVTAALNPGSDASDKMHDVRDDIVEALSTQSDLAGTFPTGFISLILRDEEKSIKLEERVLCGVRLRYDLKFRTTIKSTATQR